MARRWPLRVEPKPRRTSRQKEASKSQEWRHLTEDIDTNRQEIEQGHFGEKYVYGEDPELDAKHERRWAMLMERAPAYVPITPDIPEEYLEEIEHDNAVYELIWDQINAEREAISWRHEKVRRKR